jgi:hypothetical protein
MTRYWTFKVISAMHLPDGSVQFEVEHRVFERRDVMATEAGKATLEMLEVCAWMPWLEFWVVQDMDGFESADVSMAVDLLNWMEMERIKQARDNQHKGAAT